MKNSVLVFVKIRYSMPVVIKNASPDIIPTNRGTRGYTRISSIRVLAFFLSLLLLQGNLYSYQRHGHSELLVDANTGRQLYANNASMRIAPASLTKMMTLFVVFSLLRRSDLKLTDKVRFSRAAVRQVPSRLGIPVGGTIQVREAIYSLVTKSANDTSYAVAEHIAGSEKKFATLMNTYASRLGMSGTKFVNATGLHNPRQLSTANDMARLAVALWKIFPEDFHYFSKRGFFHKGRYFPSHNKILGFSKDEFLVDGIKTGFVNASGFNIVASATKGGHRLIAIVMGANTARERDATVQKLLKYGFNRLESESSRIHLTALHRERRPSVDIPLPPVTRPVLTKKTPTAQIKQTALIRKVKPVRTARRHGPTFYRGVRVAHDSILSIIKKYE